jgi:cell wall-associated NlpC family hydrolase
MIKLTPKQKQLITEAVLADYPNECCGFLVKNDFVHLQNIADDTKTSFKINPQDTAKWADKIIAIVHSHTRDINQHEVYDLRTPSQKDYIGQKLSGLPWLIFGTEGENITDPVELPRTPSSDYIGRQFIWYINDCFTLVQDYYRFELGIDIGDYPKEFDWKNFTDIPELLEQYYREYGFIDSSINELKNGDILLMNSMRMHGNHLGIYHEGNVLHQDGLSVSMPFSIFNGRIKKVLRYAD